MPGPGDPAEVVPPEVDEHHVLGALLRVALELVGEERVLLRVGAARAGAGDGVRGQLVADDLEQQLRAGADDLERRDADEEQVRAGVHAAERPVQADAIDRSAVGPVGAGRSYCRRASTTWIASPAAIASFALTHRVDVAVAAEARVDVLLVTAARRRSAVAAGARRRELGRAGPRRPLQRLEDRPLGDPVAALEVGRVRVERRDRLSVWVRWSKTRTRSLSMNAAVGTPTGSRSGSGTRGLERGDRVVRERADRTAREARHALRGQDACGGR